jgi:dGTPase
MIDFTKRIKPERLNNTKERNDLASLLFDFESDRGRIINSAAVRRLQQKTQVFPLERNSAVRSRLTHSLEVQQVGRFIVQSIFNKLTSAQQKQYNLQGLERHIESMVEMSCLLHDVGNPPFGHFGEEAIKNWFHQNLDSPSASINKNNSLLSAELLRDICNFEGNAQAIRLIQSLLRLNLTYSQVAGVLKYTRCGTEVKPDENDELSYLKKKVGYYYSEKSYVKKLCETLEFKIGHRHFSSYIMEAADDISYCIADIEDAVEKGILDIEKLGTVLNLEFIDILKKFELKPACIDMEKIISKAFRASEVDGTCQESQFFISLRVGILHPLVKHSVARFITNINEIYNGSFNHALLEDKSHEHAIALSLKNVAFKYVFNNKEVEIRELQGYKIISGLLDCYKPLLELDRIQFTGIINNDKGAPLLEKRLFKKLSGKHIRSYLDDVKYDKSDEIEFYYRCRLVQDYISGMTDQFAYDEYRSMMIAD